MSDKFYEVTAEQLYQWDKRPECRFTLDDNDVWDGLFVIARVLISFDGGTGFVHLMPLAHLEYDLALEELQRLELEEREGIQDNNWWAVAEYEIWHVVSEQDLIDHTLVAPMSGVSFVADYDYVSTLILHWVPALSAHVAVMVEANGVYFPSDWQCLQPTSLSEVGHYDWLPCSEFFGDFGAWDYVHIMDALCTFMHL